MIDLDAECTRRGRVTRICVTIWNAHSTPQRVELECTLDGPVWTPRGDPLAVPEWSGTSWCGIVPASRTRGVGFATTGEPDEPFVEVASVARAETDGTERDRVLEDLETASPPRAVVERGP